MTDTPQVDFLSGVTRYEAVDVLCDAFHNYPVMRYVLGDRLGAPDDLRTLIHFFVSARVLRDEPVLGVSKDGELVGAAIVSGPVSGDPPTALNELRDRVWAKLGSDARARYEAFGDACSELAVEEPHRHLNMIGVRRSSQGRGYARALLEAVHRVSEGDSDSAGVSLTTELESNVHLYRHFGYEVLGKIVVAPALETWTMYRRNEGIAE